MFFFMEPVPPPDETPVDELASCYELVEGLRMEMHPDQYRCASCKQMQPRESAIVWVPYGTRPGDPAWSVTERCRQYAYNGEWSGWCLPCAKSLSPEPPKPEKPKGLLQRIRAALHRT